jgi:predicted secreted Zn-dependent protease
MLPSTIRRPGLRLLVVLSTLLLASVLLAVPVAASVAHRLSAPAPVVLTERGAGLGGPATSAASDVALAAPPPEPSGDQATTTPVDGVRMTATTDYYAIEGSSLSALLASLRERGPNDGHGTWAANTAWVFRWSYQPRSESGCRVASAKVDLALTYTYPRWTAPGDAAPGLVAAWDGYLANVELHEHGHRDIAEAAAADLVRTLQELPAQTSCDALAATARASASQLLARHSEAQRVYDQETGHGELQGAVLAAQGSVE